MTSDSTSDSTSRFPGIAKIPTVGEPISAINFAVGRSYRGDSSMTPELDGVEFTVDAYEFDFDYETGNDLIVMTVTSNGETWETMTPGDSTSTLLA